MDENKEILEEIKEETAERESVSAPEPEVVEEKDSTVELREQYEEKTGEEIVKKRKYSKKRIALTCVGGFILLVLVAVGLFFLIEWITFKPMPGAKDVPQFNAPPEKAVQYSAEQQTALSAALALIEGDTPLTEANKTDIKETIAMMYQKANRLKIECDQALAVLRGKGSAEIAVGSGSMMVRGIKVQAGSEFYYQKAAMIYESSIKSNTVLKGLKASLNQQERAYTNGTDDFRLTGTLKGDDAKIWDEEEYETVPYILPEVPDTMTSYSEDDFKTKGYYLEDPREITNFKIEAQYIVLKDLPEGQNYIEEAEDDVGNKYYICRFSLAYLEDDCVRIARQYLRDSAQKDAKEQNLQYGKFDITMEVWENGYLKRMYDEEEWEGSVDGFTTTSTSDYESVIYYDYDERIFSKEDQTLYEDDDEGANWAYNIVARYKAEIDEIG